MTMTWCVGGRHYSNANNITVSEKRNPGNRKSVKIIEGDCNICGRNKVRFLLSK